MLHFTWPALIGIFLMTNALAQSPTAIPPVSGALVPTKSILPSPSPSATPTREELVNSLSQADLQAAITLLKSNFTSPDAITDTELNRATVEGLMIRLPRGVMLLPNKESAPGEAPGAFYGEVLGGHIGYLRLGSLNSANLQAIDKSLSNFAAKKVDALIVDLRSSQGTGDFAVAADFAKRFCPKGKPLFTLRKPAVRQDRVFSSDREPAFRGLVMVLADGDTSRAADCRTRGRILRFVITERQNSARCGGGNDFAGGSFIISRRGKTRFACRDAHDGQATNFSIERGKRNGAICLRNGATTHERGGAIGWNESRSRGGGGSTATPWPRARETAGARSGLAACARCRHFTRDLSETVG